MSRDHLASRLLRFREDSFDDSFTAILPSQRAGFKFHTAVKYRWRTRRRLREELKPVVGKRIREVVSTVLRRHEVFNCEPARQDVEVEIGRHLPLRLGLAKLLEVRCKIWADPGSYEAATRLQAILRQAETDELLRQQAVARMKFIREQVLVDPASAQIYVLAASDGLLSSLPTGEALNKLINDLGWYSQENQWLIVARMLHEFLKNLTPSQAGELLNALGAAADAVGENAVADKLRALRMKGSLHRAESDGSRFIAEEMSPRSK